MNKELDWSLPPTPKDESAVPSTADSTKKETSEKSTLDLDQRIGLARKLDLSIISISDDDMSMDSSNEIPKPKGIVPSPNSLGSDSRKSDDSGMEVDYPHSEEMKSTRPNKIKPAVKYNLDEYRNLPGGIVYGLGNSVLASTEIRVVEQIPVHQIPFEINLDAGDLRNVMIFSGEVPTVTVLDNLKNNLSSSAADRMKEWKYRSFNLSQLSKLPNFLSYSTF